MMMNCPDALRMIPLASKVWAGNDGPARKRIPSARRIFITELTSAERHFFAVALDGLVSVLAAGLSAALAADADFPESESFFAACL